MATGGNAGNPLLNAALAYAAMGWPVFPCHQTTKAPLVKGDPDPDKPGETIPNTGGVKKASTDKDAIRAWWTRWPKAMIAVAVGTAIDGFVVDVDACTDEKTGEVFTLERLLADLKAEIGVDLPADTVTSATPRGGRHVFLRPAPGDEWPKNRVGKDSLIKHVDIRSTGGYVIVAPSARADGKRYDWLHSPRATSIATAPAELLDCALRRGRWLKEAPGARPARTMDQSAAAQPPHQSPSLPSGFAGTRPSTLADGADSALERYARAALDAETATLAATPAGERNHAINRAAFALGQLVGAGALSEGDVRGALYGVVRAWPNVKKSEKTVESGIAAGIATPRDLSEIEAKAAERAARAELRNVPPPDLDAYGFSSSSPSAPQPREGVGRTGETLTRENDPSEEKAPDEAPPVDFKTVPDEKVRACTGLDHSDTDNGLRLRTYFGDDLLVLKQENIADGDWLRWNGKIWDLSGGAAGAEILAQQIGELILREADLMEQTEGEAKRIAAGDKALIEMAEIEAKVDRAPADMERVDKLEEIIRSAVRAKEALYKRRGKRRDFAVTSKNHARIVKMLACAAPHLRRDPAAFNADPFLVATNSHTLRFVKEVDPENPDETGTRHRCRVDVLAGHRRADLVTSIVAVDYDPKAQGPKWAAFLARFLPSSEVRRTVQQFMGLSLLGIPVQRLMFHYGTGANGKSVFLEVCVRVLGKTFAVSLPPETFVGGGDRKAGGPSEDVARLYGKRMLRIHEIKPGAYLQESLVKALTGGEEQTARRLHSAYFDFQNVAKPHLSGNGMPQIDGADNGIWRRIMVVEWPVTLTEAEQRDFEEVVSELTAEAPAILNWMIAGACEVLAGGLFVAPEVRAKTLQYRTDMDPTILFIGAHVKEAPGENVQAREMYRAFVAYCEANGKKPIQETKFGRVMKEKIKRDDSGRVHVYVDVALHDVPQTQSERAGEPPPPESMDF